MTFHSRGLDVPWTLSTTFFGFVWGAVTLGCGEEPAFLEDFEHAIDFPLVKSFPAAFILAVIFPGSFCGA